MLYGRNLLKLLLDLHFLSPFNNLLLPKTCLTETFHTFDHGWILF